MLTILIVIVLLLGFYNGYRRGLIGQLLRLFGYGISVVLATKFYEPLSQIAEMIVPFPSIQQHTQLVLYDEATGFILDQAFYRVVTFILIAFIGWLVTNFVGLFFMKLEYYDIFKHANHIVGGIIGVVISYCIVFIGLFVLSLIPIEWVQQQFVNSPLAYWIVSQTPIISDLAMQTWLQVKPF